MRYQRQLIAAVLILAVTMGTFGCAMEDDRTLQANVEAETAQEEKSEEESFALQRSEEHTSELQSPA